MRKKTTIETLAGVVKKESKEPEPHKPEEIDCLKSWMESIDGRVSFLETQYKTKNKGTIQTKS